MSERPPAGWFPDPSGRNEQRYWDGESWTKRVRNPTATPAPDAPPADSPPETVTITGGESSPRMTRAAIQDSRRSRSRWPWVLGAVVLVALLGVGGYALLGGGDSGTDRVATTSPTTPSTTAPSTTSTTVTPGSTTASTSPDTTPTTTAVTIPEPDAAASAITRAEFDAVALGTTQGELIQQLGKRPASSQKFVDSKALKEADIQTTCLYYSEAGNGFQSGFRFCYPLGTLKNKKAF